MSLAVAARPASSLHRAVAAATFAVALAGLAGQVVLSVEAFLGRGETVLDALWRLAGFFSIWTNVCVAAVAAAALVGRATARERIAVLPAIVVVGVAYTVLLRPLITDHSPPQLVVSSLLHDWTPALFLLLVLTAPAVRVPWRAARWALLLPAIYMPYGTLRGVATGWFPYWFLDPTDLGWLGVAGSIALLGVAFLALGLVVAALERWRA